MISTKEYDRYKNDNLKIRNQWDRIFIVLCNLMLTLVISGWPVEDQRLYTEWSRSRSHSNYDDNKFNEYLYEQFEIRHNTHEKETTKRYGYGLPHSTLIRPRSMNH